MPRIERSGSLSETLNITIIGDGGWGTALSLVLLGKGHRVLMWSAFAEHVEAFRADRENKQFLPGIALPPELEFTTDIDQAVAHADMLVAAVPTGYMRATFAQFAGKCRANAPIVNVAKGIERETLMRGSEVLADVLGRVPIGIMCGPSHAEEVARRLPTTVVASAHDPALATHIQRVFMGERFRVYTNPDMIGMEIGASVKNVIAIAGGICDGLEFGDNTKAALVTRGLAEIARLGCKLGARRSTFAGLTGLGDLITTCVSPYGRNRHLGEEIAKGKTLSQVTEQMHGQVAEGVLTTKSACALADRHGVDMPITREIYEVLFASKSPLDAVTDLMMRAPKSEVEELE